MTASTMPLGHSAPAVRDPARPQALATWLLTVAALILIMVMVGGITRLTESGLSITEWKPISGTLPPLTDAQWQEAFRGYQQIPQYQQINHGISLEEFKGIFFWEYVHRLLGRVIGLVIALPLLWFWVRKAIPRGYGVRLVGILLLIGLQGVIGWWMVASGLSVRTEVSHVRLAVHLLTALLLFSAVVWTALDLRSPGHVKRRLPTLMIWSLAALGLQLMFGAFVAGLRAGYAFNTWPLMDGEFYPRGYEWLQPALRNFVDNPTTVQFVHRWLAFGVLAFAIVVARQVKRLGSRRESIILHSVVGVQILLGIATLLTGVDHHLAATHQGVAVLLLGAFLLAGHRIAVLRGAARA